MGFIYKESQLNIGELEVPFKNWDEMGNLDLFRSRLAVVVKKWGINKHLNLFKIFLGTF